MSYPSNMGAAPLQRNQSNEKDTKAPIGVLEIPEGYELSHYTVRRKHDGYLQSYRIVDNSPVRVPISTQLSGGELPGLLQRDPQVFSPSLSTYNVTDLQQAPRQQTYSTPMSEDPGNFAGPDNKTRVLSAQTQKRRAHLRDDGYTSVCGVYSPEKSKPVKKYNNGNGDFCCPRCESNFTRRKTVKDHFPSCIAKHGNPQRLHFTDHSSMAMSGASIQRGTRTSRAESSTEMESDDFPMDVQGQEIKLEEMNEALARTSLHGTQTYVQGYDGRPVKTEFVFGADIPYESIETPERQCSPTFSESGHPSLRSSSRRSPSYISQTPDWQNPQGSNSRRDSSTPTPRSNPWNIGVSVSDTENQIADMRDTAPFEGWLHESQTPEPRNHAGIIGDGLDDYMDRRTHFSPTPTESRPAENLGEVYEDYEMEE